MSAPQGVARADSHNEGQRTMSIKKILTALNKAKEKREDVADSFVELMSQAIMEREG